MSKFTPGDVVVINHNHVAIYPAEPADKFQPQRVSRESLHQGFIVGEAKETTYRYAGQIPFGLVRRSNSGQYVFVAQDMVELYSSNKSTAANSALELANSSAPKFDATPPQNWFQQYIILLLTANAIILLILMVVTFRRQN